MQALTAERLVGEGVRDRARIDAEAAEAGREALIKTVAELTGVTVDHYAEIGLLGFAPDHRRARRRRRLPEGRRRTNRFRARDFPAGPQTLTAPTRSRSSASATACRAATSTGSAASRW